MNRLIAQIAKYASQSPDRAAVQTADRVISFSELAQRCGQLAAALVADGVQPDDRAILSLESAPEFVIGYVGALQSNATVVTSNPAAPLESKLATCRDCQPTVAILDSLPPNWLAPLASVAPSLRAVYVAHGGAARTEQGIAVRPLADMISAAPVANLAVESEGSQVALIVYTSGTTGRPKGVMLSHDNLDAIADAGCQMVNLSGQDRVGILSPLFHLYGLREVDAALRLGATVVLAPGGPFLASALQLFSTCEVTGISAVPSTLQIVAEKYRGELAQCADQLRFLTMGTAPLNKVLLRSLREVLPSTRLIVTYGLTEVSRVCYREVRDDDDHSPRNVGRPYPGVQISLLGGDGDMGQVAIRSPMNMLGYWKQPEATRSVVTSDGLVLAPDCATFDSDGNLHLFGRIDDVINCGGQKVSPDEVEEALARHPGVAVVAAVGGIDPAGMLGEVVRVMVVRRDPALTVDELLRHAAQYLEPYKLPRLVDFVDEIPCSVLGKPQRSRLKTSVGNREPRSTAAVEI